MPDQTPTYIERVDGRRDAWDNAQARFLFDDGYLEIVRDDTVIAYYAPGQWITTYSDVQPTQTTL